MPGSVQAVAIAFFAVLPGALYIWGLERYVGKWNVASPDRLLHFIAVSAAFHASAAPATYALWDHYLRSERWSSSDALPLGLWGALLLYLLVPFALGTLVGARAARARLSLRQLLAGKNDPPRAWDYFFGQRPDGWMRIRLKSGRWIGGAYANGSWASGYPEQGDLYLNETVEIEEETGAFMFDESGAPTFREEKLLIRWEEIEFIEFIDG